MTAPVSFINPLTITSSMITSSTAVTHSSTEAEWASTTSYTVGTIVFRSTLGRRFQCLIAGVDSNAPETAQDRWYDLGATSSLTMFDDSASTQSIADGVLTTVFRPGAFDSLYLGGMDGTSLTVTIKDAPGGNAVYSYTGALENSQPSDYYEYFFAPFKSQTDFLVTGLAPFASCEVTISVTYTSGIAKCGMASLGNLVSLGGVGNYGATVEPKSYARIVTDAQGKTTIKKGKAARDLSITAYFPIALMDDVVTALLQVLGVPCVWIGTDLTTMQSMRTFGLGNGKVSPQNAVEASLSLTVQGMI